MLGDLFPLLLAKLPYRTEMHDTILYFAEVMLLILSADSYEVDASFVIVKSCAGGFSIIVARGVHNRSVLEVRHKSSNNLDTATIGPSSEV